MLRGFSLDRWRLLDAPVLIGTLGIVQHDAVQGRGFEILAEVVVELPKSTPLAIDLGDRLFWNTDGARKPRYSAIVCRHYRPGPWRTARTPYLKEIMDHLSPSQPCQRVVFMKGAQTGGERQPP